MAPTGVLIYEEGCNATIFIQSLDYVFSTELRRTLLDTPKLRDELNVCIATELKTLKCEPVKVNCVSDPIQWTSD